MSLNWNVGAIKTWKATGKMVADCNNLSHDGDCQKCPKVPQKAVHDAAGKPIPWAITNGLIWASMVVQMDGIRTEKAAKEFAIRLAIYQDLHGDFLSGRDGGRAISTAEVYAHIGLTTNVSTKTRASFMKAVTGSIESDAAKKVLEDLDAMADATDAPWALATHMNAVDRLLKEQTGCYSTLDSVEAAVGPIVAPENAGVFKSAIPDDIYPMAEALIMEHEEIEADAEKFADKAEAAQEERALQS